MLALRGAGWCNTTSPRFATEAVVIHGDAVAERLGEDATLDQLMDAFDAELLQELDGRLAV